MKTTIYHPETKELSTTIEKVKDNDGNIIFEVKDNTWNYEDWLETYTEALEWCKDILNNTYTGKEAAHIMSEKAYARSESIACGNY